MIGIKKVQGGSLEDTMLVTGVAFQKTFSYAGFEMQQKQYENPKVMIALSNFADLVVLIFCSNQDYYCPFKYFLQIALLNVELELKAEKENAEVRVDNVEEYQKVVDAEWNILYEKLDLIVKSGAKVVLSKLPIGDVATQVIRNPDRSFGRFAIDFHK